MFKTILASIVLVSSFAFAQQEQNSEAARIESSIKANADLLQKCVEEDGGLSTAGMKMCQAEANERSDKLLNVEYKKIVKHLENLSKNKDEFDKESAKETLRRLVSAQRAWITFRDANCSLVATSSLGGTMEGLEQLSCIGDMTEARTLELVKMSL